MNWESRNNVITANRSRRHSTTIYQLAFLLLHIASVPVARKCSLFPNLEAYPLDITQKLVKYIKATPRCLTRMRKANILLSRIGKYKNVFISEDKRLVNQTK